MPPPTSADPEALLLVGRVLQAHGLRGEVKVLPETDDPERLAELETLYLGRSPEQARPHALQAVREQTTKRGLLLLVQFEGVDSREDAEAHRGASVYAHEDDLPPLAEDEFFLHDLVGLDVFVGGERVGEVEDVLETPAQPTLRIARPGRPDALVPAVAEFLADIDLDAGRLVLDPIEGLLE